MPVRSLYLLKDNLVEWLHFVSVFTHISFAPGFLLGRNSHVTSGI